jgi:hypothetical protein
MTKTIFLATRYEPNVEDEYDEGFTAPYACGETLEALVASIISDDKDALIALPGEYRICDNWAIYIEEIELYQDSWSEFGDTAEKIRKANIKQREKGIEKRRQHRELQRKKAGEALQAKEEDKKRRLKNIRDSLSEEEKKVFDERLKKDDRSFGRAVSWGISGISNWDFTATKLETRSPEEIVLEEYEKEESGE